MTPGLRKRRRPFVQIPSSTIRDARLSFRARGVLAWLLDHPEDWSPKSEVIAAAGKEGREAIRAALRELGEHGYYRLEQRRHLNNRFTTGAAVSEEPVQQWAEEYREYKGSRYRGRVPVVEQPDGTWLVQRRDGTLTGDGFDPPEPPAPEDIDDPPPGEHTDSEDADTIPEDRSPGFGSPDAGSPDAGPPDSGNSGFFNKTEKQDRETDSEMPPSSASPRPGPESSGTAKPRKTAGKAATGKSRGRAKADRTPEEQARFEAADRIAHGWWDVYCPQHGIPVTSAQNKSPAAGFPGFRKLLESFLAAGCTENELKHALVTVGRAWPSRTVLEAAVSQRRGYGPAATAARGAPVYNEPGAAESLAGVFDW